MSKRQKHLLSYNASEGVTTKWWRFNVSICGRTEPLGSVPSCMTSWKHEVTCGKCLEKLKKENGESTNAKS